MTTVPFAVLAAAGVAMIACVLSVFAWWRSSVAASQLRSMRSLQGELNEIRDYLGKIDAWAKRINARDVMNERRESSAPQPRARTAPGAPPDKEELRRIAGILPGHPVQHR